MSFILNQQNINLLQLAKFTNEKVNVVSKTDGRSHSFPWQRGIINNILSVLTFAFTSK